MKRYIISIALCLSTLAVGAQKQLTILHTNDTHSCIEPLSINLADTMQAGRGGFLRRLTMIEQERKKDPKLLLLDSGDFSQGSPYYTLFKGDVEIELMNRMHYDASTVGNHEFDFGLENMARLFKMANFPIICSNYDFTGTPVEGLTKPYIVLKRQGVKIGIFALDPKMEGLVATKNFVGVKYLDPIEVANCMTKLLKEEKKCDVVILISHLGWDESGMNEQKLIAASRGIDLVLGGHSHTYFQALRYVTDLDGRQVPVDQNGKNAIFVGKMTLDLQKK
ncbi:bifunctional UDP-sugar hydrolase/5'-nucleotidase [Prevotella sp. S7 MS 2]|uniref:bifunctional metallophosphatase/5'-nucleotidase n=1 Tax=Prevotella sp. S7 MS 2 TaxID=1287488 RepID=UPI000513FCAC|nr:bifunctional UDP-sugar hydrolase/5'-nucleotidase [Prevotella sp. S7 MS 2]KGI60316.1 5'-nucleotidase [Prevotella sp. S7 MS 2]